MAYLARIAEVNPILHAVIETNPDALYIAASLDAERKAGNVIGPLHGVPILIKDNIATFDKMNTTAGSFSLLGAKVTEDSTMAAKLRKEIDGEWLLGISGAVSILFGIAIMARPAVGALAMVFFVGGWAILHGAILIALAVKARKFGSRIKEAAVTAKDR